MALPAPFDFASLLELPVDEDRPNLHVGWLRLPAFPLRAEQRPHLATLLLALFAQAREAELRTRELAAELYVQMSQLERPEGPLLMSSSAMRWKPRIGLAVWPDRDPPRPLSKEDVFETPPDQPMRQTSFHAMRIAGDAVAEAAGALAGSGALALLAVDAERWPLERREVSAHLERHMTSETFQGYPMYFPMLDEGSVEALPPAELEACLKSVTLYMREDTEKSAVFLLSRIPFTLLFKGLLETERNWK